MLNKFLLLLTVFFLFTGKATAYEATYYGNEFVGQKMANGSVYLHTSNICASTSFKLGTKLLVKNPKTNKQVNVIVADVGGFPKGTLDLSLSAFKKIAPISMGRIRVLVKVLN